MSTQTDKKTGKKPDQTMFRRIFGALAKDLWIMVLDVAAVNLSYYLALLIRFYVNNQFRPTVRYYLSDFAHFAPFYTILCILVFAVFRLYNGMWRYAGINDMNRIIGASAATSVLQIAGTLIFIRRMPITYYVIGGVLQFIFISLIRFAYRFVIVEHKRIANKKLPAVNVLIVGAGEIGHRVIKQLEEDSAYRPVCILDNKSDTDGKTFDGIPVLSGIADSTAERLEKTISEYGVKAVFIADPILPKEARVNIKKLCAEKELDLQDYTGYLSNLTGRVSLTGLLETAKGPVVIRRIQANQKSQDPQKNEREYENGEAALQHLTDRYTVTGVSAEGGKLTVEIRESSPEAYSGYDAWLQKHKEETGEEVSYF